MSLLPDPNDPYDDQSAVDAAELSSAPYPEPAAAAVPPVVRRFCPTCGTPWDPAEEGCPQCARRPEQLQAALAGAAQDRASRRAIISVLALYAVLLGSSLVGCLAGAEGAPQAAVELAIGGIDTLAILCWAAVQWRSAWDGLRRPGPGAAYFLMPLLAAGTFVLATACLWLMGRVVELPIISLTSHFKAEGYSWQVVFWAICIQPAVFEELAFRGLMMSSLQRALRPREAVAVSAAMFAILHLSLPSLPHLFVMGWLLGVVRQRSGSLYPCILLHFTHNLLCLLGEHFWGI